MTMSSLSQIANIFPAPVFVFGDGGCVFWVTSCGIIVVIAADDQNTVTSRGSSIICYSEIDFTKVFMGKLRQRGGPTFDPVKNVKEVVI